MHRLLTGLTLRRRVCAFALPAILLQVAACSPTFNWRVVRPDGGGVQTLMPCKPETAERSVPLGTQPSVLHMASCRTGGLTYALAWIELSPDADVQEAMQQWQSASRQAVRAGAEQAWSDWAVEGAQTVRSLGLSGQDHAGKPTQARLVYAVNGRRLYQAAVYGPELADEALEPFFGHLKVLP